MAEYRYPSTDYDKARNLLAMLGSHWYNTYQGQHLVSGYTFARGQEEAQAHLDLLEAVASLSRLETPVFHRDNWYLLTLKESELNNDLLKYDEGAVYGYNPDGTLYEYGIPSGGAHGLYEFPIPADLKDVNQVFNRITEPSLSYTKGIDFQLPGDATILFRTNPFDSDLLPKREVYEGSEVTDREVDIWVYRGEFDWNHLHNHWGFVLAMYLESSEDYKDLLNAIFDAYTEGTAEKQVEAAFAAISGTPLVVESTETVEVIQTDSSHIAIITDKNVYRFPTNAVAIVAVGDVLLAGDQLVDTVTFYDFNRGVTPAEIAAVTVGLGFLPGEYTAGISFRNDDVPLVVTSDDNGITRVSFEIGGFPADTDAFWDEVHADGIARGLTLARMLDVRGTDAPSEPTAASLPATINPLEFLVENVLRGNAFLVRIKVARASSVLGYAVTRTLRRIIPPWTAMLVLLELDVDNESVPMTAAGDEDDPGYVEVPETFDGAEPAAESITTASVDECPVLRQVDGVCQ
jgi:hypothetical protein